ncbi:hypothetical protein EYZ11_004744 [Aspergillus tanneri]|uniref:Uncharacterized protein n=1 Tax=Aspergillus tanneri TaxID=1220188 RepID=A0A4S3JQM1_9EURO|nr:uncharacterized protein ATNIH1004_005935 [Aspergillus tanneri]KAA8647245.1 hypothetical protein ATNIH1004_005935 [Aspergillus tanneri]THC95791.1 hypothetical protein EYZ11_004744 [Aspergillus tanneri]
MSQIYHKVRDAVTKDSSKNRTDNSSNTGNGSNKSTNVGDYGSQRGAGNGTSNIEGYSSQGFGGYAPGGSSYNTRFGAAQHTEGSQGHNGKRRSSGTESYFSHTISGTQRDQR